MVRGISVLATLGTGFDVGDKVLAEQHWRVSDSNGLKARNGPVRCGTELTNISKFDTYRAPQPTDLDAAVIGRRHRIGCAG